MNDEVIINQDELGDAPKKRRGLFGRRKSDNPGGGRGSNRRHWKRAFKWFCITLLLIIIAAVAFVFFNLSKVSVNPFGFGKLKGEDRGRVNIMMLGIGDPGHEGENLSDTNILLSIDTRNHKIAVISIPRDTRVDLPNGGEGKINAAHVYGGIDGSKKVFEDTLGQPVDYYVRVNFSGLKQVVDAVGGVDVDNKELLSDTEYPCDANEGKSCGYRLTPGKYHLNGTQALKYVRCRKGTCGNDFGRAERQQQVMQSIRTRMSSAGTITNPVAIGKLISAAGSNIKTDLSINNLMRLNDITKVVDQNNTYDVVFNIDDDGFLKQSGNSSDLLPADGTFADIKKFVADIFNLAPVWTEHPNVIVQNGTTTAGLGATFSTELEKSGQYLTVSAVTNASTRDYATTQIIDYSGGTKKHTLDFLKSTLKVQTITQPPATAPKSNGDVVVILGADYAARQQSTTGAGASTTSGTTAR